MAQQLPLIVIYRHTTPGSLATAVASMEPPFAIQGKGARARRLLKQLDNTRSDMRVGRFGDEWVAVVGENSGPFSFMAPGD
ncbi:MAG: hypothetical protein H0W97_02890 [Actinobacteria bacterium]|nr:hypothetical protein [Actinomycetota bacterium]